MPGYDPVRLAERVEQEVSKPTPEGPARKYWRFRHSHHYGGNAAGDVVGCNLRCAYCWAWPFAHRTGPGRFYTPGEAARLIAAQGPYRVARLTGGEPTIAWGHTRELALILARSGRLFVLETNGILIGAGTIEPRDIPREILVRISIKAPTPQSFHKITLATPQSWHLPLKAAEKLLEHGWTPGKNLRISIALIPGLRHEYPTLLEKLEQINPKLLETLEPEPIKPYKHVLPLLEKRGLKHLFK